MSLLILSWNCNGGDLTKVANFVVANKIDLVAVQEAPGTFGISALATLKGYSWATTDEYAAVKLKGSILDAKGSERWNAVAYKTSKLTLKSFALLDYTKDKNTTFPTNVDDARAAGFASRQPAVATFTVKPTKETLMLFTWHAPTYSDLAHTKAMQNFDNSAALSDAVKGADATIIAGDLNDTNIKPYFNAFTGIQEATSQKDYILACGKGGKALAITDLGKGLNLKSDHHWAMFGQVG